MTTTNQEGYKGTIVLRTFVVFMLLSLGLVATDMVPEAPKIMADTLGANAIEAGVVTQEQEQDQYESPLPVRVVIESIGVDVPVSSPEDADIPTLDNALLTGAVRYPTSGTLVEDKNMLIFGHSSHLLVVRNKAFQAFNDLEKLQSGAVIRVDSSTHEYLYRVTSVRRADASEALVRFDTGTKKLTLSTCDTFGEKSERYVVEAEFVGKTPIVKK